MAHPIFAFINGMDIPIILVVILVLFGGKRMPELARSLGKTIREFKKATSGVEEQIKRAIEEEPPPVKPRKKSPKAAGKPKAAPAPAQPDSISPADAAGPDASDPGFDYTPFRSQDETNAAAPAAPAPQTLDNETTDGGGI